MTAVTPAQATRLIAKAKRTALEDRLLADLRKLGLPVPQREFKFAAPARQWACDFCYPAHMLIIECEGGSFSGGRHVRGAGFAEDCVKYNWASLLGYTVLRYTGAMIRSGEAAREIAEALNG